MNYRFFTALATTAIILLSGCTAKPNSVLVSPSPTISPTTTETPSPTVMSTASPSATPLPTKRSTPKASAQPLIDCTGPYGKTIKMTQKSCDDFNKAWNKATPTSVAATTTQVTGCAAYNPTGSLGTIRVAIKMESGQSWTGQGTLRVSQKYSDCRGNGLDYPWSDVINGTLTRDFGGLRPGPYKVEVTYNNKPWSSDVTINGGTNDVSVTLSNN